jgi:hypothetical protein
MVNRVWLGHFGRGIVNTPSDFGTRGELPSHPDLLNWLAGSFAAEATGRTGSPGSGSENPVPNPYAMGWSLKKLHRLILLSSVYQQASDAGDARPAADPENTLLWKMNRRRLDFEALRDTLLAASGQLDLRTGGRPVNLATLPHSTRRTVYGFIDRQQLPGLYRAFDFPNPDSHNPQRYATTSPQQSLFLMNSPFAQQCAHALVTRPEVSAPQSAPARVRRLYALLYQREPTPGQLRRGLDYVGNANIAAPGGPWEQYAQALLLTNELAFVD